MIVEIYDDGKCLKEIPNGEISVLSYYIGVNGKGVAHAENNITLGIGTDNYWHCIVKLSKQDCYYLESFLNTARMREPKDNHIGVVKSNMAIVGEIK